MNAKKLKFAVVAALILLAAGPALALHSVALFVQPAGSGAMFGTAFTDDGTGEAVFAAHIERPPGARQQDGLGSLCTACLGSHGATLAIHDVPQFECNAEPWAVEIGPRVMAFCDGAGATRIAAVVNRWEDGGVEFNDLYVPGTRSLVAAVPTPDLSGVGDNGAWIDLTEAPVELPEEQPPLIFATDCAP